MKKFLLFLVVYLMTILGVNAAPVGRQKAQAIARNFMEERGMSVTKLHSSAERLAKVKADGTQPFYVFNNGQNGGFVIISGDDKAPAVLGYSYTGTFEEANVPENVTAWLNNYAEQMETLADETHVASLARKVATQKSRISISPLVMTHWNQYAPYFNLTPTLNNVQCLTGCVATAFAQVMKYYEWPKAATTVVPGYTWRGNQLEDLPAITFDWDNMLYDYQGGGNANAGCSDGEVYQTAVAQLMKYCGYSVRANYGTGETSASTSYIPSAMRDYFGYEGSIKLVDRSNYSCSDWEELIYNELYEGRPVIYSGTTGSGSGHAFICDGYGEDGFFHINWGWGGMSDGYYLLSILEPGKQGAGGSNSGYNYEQQVIVGIQPEASEEEIYTGPCLKILNFQLRDYNSDYVSTYGPQYFGVGYQLQGLMDGEHQLNAQLLQNGEVVYEGSLLEGDYWGINLGVGHFNPRLITYPFFHQKRIADGTYEVRLVCRMKEEGKEYDWLPCQGSEYYHNEVTINGNSVTYHNSTVSPQVTCNSFTTSPTLYVNNKATGVASLTNEGGIFFQGKIYLWVNGSLVASDMAYIDSDNTINMTFSFTPTVTGNLPVKITTDANGEDVIYEETITVINEDESAAYSLVVSDWSIDNLDTESNKICGGKVTGTLTITNTGTKTFSGIIGIGYTDSNGRSSMSYDPSGCTLAVGESVDLEYTVEDATVGKRYKLACWENVDWGKKIGETTMCELVAGGYTYWTADGISKSRAETSNENIAVVDNAVAVKFFYTPTGTITPNANPNTLYYFSETTAPASLSGKNVVLNGKIDKVTFTDGYDFYVPLGFTASQAIYTRKPKLGADGSRGWESIVLPFAAQKAFNQTDNKQIYWFTDRNDDGKDFWLKSFAYTDGEAVYFDFVDEIRANVPYIIATPGSKWGESYNLLNKTIAFSADNVNITETSKLKAMTDAFDFVGLSEQKSVSGYVLDENGQYFVKKDGVHQNAFRAYFIAGADNPIAHAPRLRIGTFVPDGISEVENMTNGKADVYTLNGTKIATVRVIQGSADLGCLPSGIYIINGKKIIK
ncbi:MAG: C10 family peptidase [Prevotella sp.]|nr:C10 family peptidase [Prevotella sp.]